MKNILLKPVTHSIIVAIIGIAAAFCFPRHAPDTGRYMSQAVNLFNSGIYSFDGKTQTARDMPGLPVLFCFAMFIKADPLIFVRVLNGLFLGIIAYLSAKCFIRFNQNDNKAAVKSILLVYICGLFPTLLGSTLFVLTEIFATALFLLCNYFLFFTEKRDNKISISAAAVCCAAAFYFRPVILLYPLFLILIVIFKKLFGNRLSNKSYLLFLILNVFLTAPWIIRNYYAFGKIVPGSTASGWCLYIGTSKKWKAEAPDDYAYNENLVENSESLNEAEASSVLTEKAVTRIKDDFPGWIKLARYKIWNFWLEVPGSKRQIGQRWVIYIIKAISWLTVLLFIIGTVKFRKEIWLKLTLLPVIYIFLPHLIMFSMPRFRIPIDPYLILIGFSALIAIFSSKKPS
ncbi:MAG: hypothetical protein ACYTFY_08270 [Planctomycetota bacterium]|jgi:hypothetical protein